MDRRRLKRIRIRSWRKEIYVMVQVYIDSTVAWDEILETYCPLTHIKNKCCRKKTNLPSAWQLYMQILYLLLQLFYSVLVPLLLPIQFFIMCFAPTLWNSNPVTYEEGIMQTKALSLKVSCNLMRDITHYLKAARYRKKLVCTKRNWYVSKIVWITSSNSVLKRVTHFWSTSENQSDNGNAKKISSNSVFHWICLSWAASVFIDYQRQQTKLTILDLTFSQKSFLSTLCSMVTFTELHGTTSQQMELLELNMDFMQLPLWCFTFCNETCLKRRSILFGEILQHKTFWLLSIV